MIVKPNSTFHIKKPNMQFFSLIFAPVQRSAKQKGPSHWFWLTAWQEYLIYDGDQLQKRLSLVLIL